METNHIVIPKGAGYVGYLWYSNAQGPDIYINSTLETDICWTSEPSVPFIAEGYLRAGFNCYTLRMTDGKYHINHTILPDGFGLYIKNGCQAESDIPSEIRERYMITAFLPHRFDTARTGIEKLIFATRWEEKRDELCENMAVLMPQEELFIGFRFNK